MAKIRYQSTYRFSPTNTNAAKFRELKRLDAALRELWAQIYLMISDNGGLDTKRAWALREQFNAFADMCEREPLKIGHYRHIKFIWHSDGNEFGGFVEFWQERV